MGTSFNKSKKIIAGITLTSFLFFTNVASAATQAGTIDLSGCATEVVSGLLAESLASLGGSAVAGLAPRTVEGIVITGAGATQVGTAIAGEAIATSISVPVNSTVANAQLALGNVVNTASATFQGVTKMNLDAVAYGIAQCTLTAITDNTVKWIQGGFQGSGAKFAVDTNKLFNDLADAVLSDFSQQIRNVKACDFTPNFIMDLANSVETSAPKNQKYPQKVQCPFTAANVSAQAVYNDFSILGWRGFGMMLNDSGNQFGVAVVTAQEAQRRQAEAKASQDQKLNWSNGFTDIIDTENCQWPSNVQLGTYSEGGNSVPTIAFLMPDGSVDGEPEILTPERQAFYQQKFCKTTTPGKIVGDSLMKAIGAKQDRIGFADNMNKIISALLGELTKEVVTGVFQAANNATPASGPSHNPTTMTGGTGTTGVITATAASPVITVATSNPSDITPTSVTLHGVLASAGAPDNGTEWFEWGKTLSLGTITPSKGYTAGASTSTTFALYDYPLTGLTPNTTYFFRAVGKSLITGATTAGATLELKTTP